MRRADLVGQILDGRYRVIEPIGSGAMGSVYRGERLKLGRVVAIKVLSEAIPNEASRRRFEREAMAMAKLEHPHCGNVLDVGVHDDRPYVVMEFVSGQNLKDLLSGGALPTARAVEITRQVLSGLSHAHELGIIHRDIKPANIVLSQKAGLGDHVKILDFGLARFMKQDGTNLSAGLVLGTPNYMAPEQIRGGQLDHRIDIYACGIMLFELLTGTKPFHGDDPMSVCMQHMTSPAPRLADKLSGRSFGALEDIIARALAKDPEQRFANADEFSKALLGAASRVDQASPPAARAPHTTASPRPVARPPQPQSAKTLEIVGSPRPPIATIPLDPSPSMAQTGALTAGAKARPTSGRKSFVLVGSAVAVMALAIGGLVATRSDAKPQEHVVTPPRASATLPVAANAAPEERPRAEADPIVDLVERARELATAGKHHAAIDLLLGGRKTYPNDARLPYHASLLYLDKMWRADGLKQARTAIALDPAYRTDPELIKVVVKGFNTTAARDWALARFLQEDIGPAARPYLEDTARAHPNPIVRKRAAAELKRYP